MKKKKSSQLKFALKITFIYFFFKCKRKKHYSSKNQKKIEDSPDGGVGTHPQKT